MADNNENLPLGAAELLVEMRAMRRASQQQHQELIQVFNRSFDAMLDHFGALRKDVKAIEGSVKSIDQRLEKVEKKVDDFTTSSASYARSKILCCAKPRSMS